MHEYCTSLDGTHDTTLCARWRLRLKGAVEAYDAVAREKDEKAVKEMAQAHGEKMRELQQKLHAAKEQAAAEETARLEAALKQARAHPPNIPLPLPPLPCVTLIAPTHTPPHPTILTCSSWHPSVSMGLLLSLTHHSYSSRRGGRARRSSSRCTRRGAPRARVRTTRTRARARSGGSGRRARQSSEMGLVERSQIDSQIGSQMALRWTD